MPDQKRIVFYDYARVFAIISISFNHAVNRVFDNYHDTQAEFLATSYDLQVIKAAVTVFSRMGVPFFLMLTGALILSKSFETKDDIKRFFRHNWLGILIATEIWLFLYYWFYYYLCPGTYLLYFTRKELILRLISTMLFVNQATEGLMWYMNMLIPLYTLLPVIAVFIHKGYGKYLKYPLFFTFFVTVFTYDYARYLSVADPEAVFVTELYAPLTYFMIYVVAGYYISQGLLSKIRPWILFLFLFAGLYYAAIRYQLWYYEGDYNHLVSYDSIPLMLSIFPLFELFRRVFRRGIRFLNAIITHISRRCFGIYFVHIIIMELFNWHYDFSAWEPLHKMFFLQAVSVIGALVVIDILSIIKPIRKYAFVIK